MKAILFCLVLIAALAFGSVQAMSAEADYLHLANARATAQVHAWKNPCNSSTSTCWQYPFYTSYYQRLSNTKVRVEIGIGWYSCSRSKYAYRVLAVIGDDSNPSITSSGSAPYWSC